MIIAVDFDGTISLGKWPDVGPANKPVIDALLERQKGGDKIILWTCRGGDELDAAVAWCKIYGLEFDAVNENLPDVLEAWGFKDTRKVFADEYWDDKSAHYETNPTGNMTERELRAAATGIIVYEHIRNAGIPPSPTDGGPVEMRGIINDNAMEAALNFCSHINPNETELFWYSIDEEEAEDDGEGV